MIENDGDINPYFPLTAWEALGVIASKPVGRALLDANIDGSAGFKIKLVRGVGVREIDKPGEEGGSRAVSFNETAARGGGGAKAERFWNPNIFYNPAAGARPASIGLAHELVHCLHSVTGTMKPGYDQEEQWTVGHAPFADTAICENTIREEHGIDRRTQH